MFLTPRKTNGSVRSQQGAPTTCNLTNWEDVCPDITGQFGCGPRAKFRPSVRGGGRG